jgi:citrate lyase gamma subunit
MHPYYEDGPPDPEWDEEPCLAQAVVPLTVTLDPFVLNDLNAAIANAVQHQYKQQIERAVAKALKQLVSDTVATELAKQAESIIHEAITRPVQRTTEWGEPVGGEPTSLLARLEDELRSHFHEKVDDSGKTSRDAYRRNEQKTRLEWMVCQYAMQEVEKQAAETIKEIGVEAKAKVASSLAELLAEKLAPRIRML